MAGFPSVANEIHNVLTQTQSGVLTIGIVLSIYFSSSGVEAVRIGLNRAYDIRDSRTWWLLRLESLRDREFGASAGACSLTQIPASRAKIST